MSMISTVIFAVSMFLVPVVFNSRCLGVISFLTST